MAKNFYAVANGRKIGIFTTWDDCKASVNGYHNAQYKGFATRAEAVKWLKSRGLSDKSIQMHQKEKRKPDKAEPAPESRFDYIIYTDGGCASNPYGPGGIGVVIQNTRTGKTSEISEGYFSTTNNRMEIMAIIRAFEQIPDGASVHLFSDSTYVINTLLGKFQKGKNLDLWAKLDEVMAGKKVLPTWVKGHHGNPNNELCDSLATAAMRHPSKSDKVELNSAPDSLLGHEILTAPTPDKPEEPKAEDNIQAEANRAIRESAEKRGINFSCARDIYLFYLSPNQKFADYASIRTGGFDSWSRLKKDALIEKLGQDAWDFVSTHFDDEQKIIKALKWYGRGLTLEDSIKKVVIDEHCQYPGQSGQSG